MAAHYLAARGEVRGAAERRGQDVAYLAEVGGPEHTGSRDREELRVRGAVVGEPMDRFRGTQTASPGPISLVLRSMVHVETPAR